MGGAGCSVEKNRKVRGQIEELRAAFPELRPDLARRRIIDNRILSDAA